MRRRKPEARNGGAGGGKRRWDYDGLRTEGRRARGVGRACPPQTVPRRRKVRAAETRCRMLRRPTENGGHAALRGVSVPYQNFGSHFGKGARALAVPDDMRRSPDSTISFSSGPALGGADKTGRPTIGIWIKPVNFSRGAASVGPVSGPPIKRGFSARLSAAQQGVGVFAGGPRWLCRPVCSLNLPGVGGWIAELPSPTSIGHHPVHGHRRLNLQR